MSQVLVGCSLVLLAVTLPIPYIRIIYIFASRHKYRSLECYRIMFQIGVVQCAMAPGVLFFGTTQLWNEDILRLGSTFMKVMTTAVRMEAMLSFVLALNRLKIMCGLQYPEFYHTVVSILSWLFGLAYFSLLMTPHCDYLVIPGQFLSQYDLSKPWTATVAEIGSVSLVSTITMTLVAYVSIITYLVYLQKRSGKIPNFKNERTILLYGLLRFVVDITLAVLFNFGKLPHKPWIDFPVLLGYTFNNLLLPTVLYLCLYKQLRREFFAKSSTNVVILSTAASTNGRK
uniref:Serpentine Receptor, class T n=1 Tax=Steinernema glaseri TaxID=37863 RepID=A0A1I8AGN9_9BILA